MNRLQSSIMTLALIAFSSCLFACSNSDKEGSQVNLEEARQLIKQGSYAAAFLRLNHALEQAPRDPEIHLNLGWLYLYTNDDVRAENEWKKADELAPKRAEVAHLKGAILTDLAQRASQKKEMEESTRLYQQAVEYLERSLKENSKNYQTYFDLANAYLSLEEAQKALDALDTGFDHIPQHDLETQVEFEIASCTAHAKLGLYNEAIADCKQAEEFTSSAESKQRIHDLIEDMNLLNPPAAKNQNEILKTEPMDPKAPSADDNTGSD
jgi:tetratricopeptide (TPR) repeat protein